MSQPALGDNHGIVSSPAIQPELLQLRQDAEAGIKPLHALETRHRRGGLATAYRVGKTAVLNRLTENSPQPEEMEPSLVMTVMTGSLLR